MEKYGADGEANHWRRGTPQAKRLRTRPELGLVGGKAPEPTSYVLANLCIRQRIRRGFKCFRRPRKVPATHTAEPRTETGALTHFFGEHHKRLDHVFLYLRENKGFLAEKLNHSSAQDTSFTKSNQTCGLCVCEIVWKRDFCVDHGRSQCLQRDSQHSESSFLRQKTKLYRGGKSVVKGTEKAL